jgi:hypothetical protein
MVLFLVIPTSAVSSNSIDRRCIILGYPHTACNKIGTIYNDGKGKKRRKSIGGNSLRIKLNNLRKYYQKNERLKGHVESWSEGFLRVHKTSGNVKYIAMHVRSKNGKWALIYKGKNRRFLLKSFETYWVKSKYTDITSSVNGAHE